MSTNLTSVNDSDFADDFRAWGHTQTIGEFVSVTIDRKDMHDDPDPGWENVIRAIEDNGG